MLPLANFMPPLPGMTALAGSLKTYAPSPVWRDSTTDDVKFQPMPKKKAVKLYHRARDFERRTRQPGKQDGALGRNGLAVLHALIFDFLDFRTGQLDPGYAAIARKACISMRSAARGLQNLEAGRCSQLAAAMHGELQGRALSCSSRTPTPMRSCPARNGAATSNRPRPPPRNPAHGAITRAACATPMTEADHRAAQRRRHGGGYPAA